MAGPLARSHALSENAPASREHTLQLQAEKRVTFDPEPAMAVRLTCLTEAGERGPWTSAAEINILGATETAADPAVIGEWGPLIRFPLVPVAAASLPGSRVRCPSWLL